MFGVIEIVFHWSNTINEPVQSLAWNSTFICSAIQLMAYKPFFI